MHVWLNEFLWFKENSTTLYLVSEIVIITLLFSTSDMRSLTVLQWYNLGHYPELLEPCQCDAY